ncbi:hypothetical protein ACQ4M4_09940 [Leptolyngbya sp. AN02str]|uniref:hypothetical protein n=1 Tax=Leptolyngbya sp. AN02str TaxID=3423363 RepID=UPI003D314A05
MQTWVAPMAVRRGLTLVHWGLAVMPTLFLIGLVGMTARAAQILGQFPQAYINDPYLFGQDDPTYYRWVEFAGIGFGLMLLSWLPWCILTALTLLFHWRYWSKTEPKAIALYRFLPIAIYVLMHVIILVEPTNRLGWFLD